MKPSLHIKSQVRWLIIPLLLSNSVLASSLQAAETPDQVIAYKEVGGFTLNLLVLKPAADDIKRPGFLYFHGGGWNNGSADKSLGFLKHFRDAGFVCASVDYRCRDTHGGTTPMDATRDARSALRAFVAHAKELGIDTDKIIVGGGSAGGHLTCMTALGTGLGEPEEEKTPAPPVAAMLLWNPVVDTTDKGYGGTRRFGDLTEKYSPVHLLKKNSPPVLVQHGDADQTVPYENAQRFIATAEKLGITCKLVTYPGGRHSFMSGADHRDQLLYSYQEADAFLYALHLWPAGAPKPTANVGPPPVTVPADPATAATAPAAAAPAAPPDPKSDRDAMFDRADPQHTGKLSREDYIARQSKKEGANERFDKMDIDKDGFLSRDEFVTMGGKKSVAK